MSKKAKKFFNKTANIATAGLCGYLLFNWISATIDENGSNDRRYFTKSDTKGEVTTKHEKDNFNYNYTPSEHTNYTQMKKNIVNNDIGMFITALNASHKIVKSYSKPKREFGGEDYCVIAPMGCLEYAATKNNADYLDNFLNNGLNYASKRQCQALFERMKKQYPDCVRYGKIKDIKQYAQKGSFLVLDKKKSYNNRGVSNSPYHTIVVSATSGSGKNKKLSYIGHNNNNKGNIPDNWEGYCIDLQKIMDRELNKNIDKIMNNKNYKTTSEKEQAVHNYLKKLYERSSPENVTRTKTEVNKINIRDIAKHSNRPKNKFSLIKNIQKNKDTYYANLQKQSEAEPKVLHSTPDQPFAWIAYNKLQNTRTA